METAIVSYRRFNDMPRDVFNQVRRMGHGEGCLWYRGHLRQLADKKRNWEGNALKYRLRNALVMYVGDTIIGWAALYVIADENELCASAWVKTRHRGQGHGTNLIEEMYKRWRHKYNPSVYRSVEHQWKILDLPK